MTIYCLGFLFLPNPGDPALPLVALILKQRGPPNVIGKWNGHGGKVEADERPIAAMIRETVEELGVETGEDTWTAFGVMRGDTWRCHLFVGWMPEGQEAKQMGDEAVAVFVAAECAGDRFVSNIPALLTLAEHALDEPAFGDSSVYIDLRYVDDQGLAWAMEVDEMMSAEVRGRLATMDATPRTGDVWTVREYADQAIRLLGGTFRFSDGQTRPILANTKGHWSGVPTFHLRNDRGLASDGDLRPGENGVGIEIYINGTWRPVDTFDDSPGVMTVSRPYRRISHIALVPDGQQPDPNCTIEIEGQRYGLEVALGQPLWPLFPILKEATATLIAPPVFTLDLSRYNRSLVKDAPPAADGSPMAVATCWTDWRVMADDLAFAGMPPELVEAVMGIESRAPVDDLGFAGEVGTSTATPTTEELLEAIEAARAAAVAVSKMCPAEGAIDDPLNEGQDKGKADAQLRAEILDLLDQLEDRGDRDQIEFGDRDMAPWQIREAIEDQRPAMLRLLDELRAMVGGDQDGEGEGQPDQMAPRDGRAFYTGAAECFPQIPDQWKSLIAARKSDPPADSAVFSILADAESISDEAQNVSPDDEANRGMISVGDIWDRDVARKVAIENTRQTVLHNVRLDPLGRLPDGALRIRFEPLIAWGCIGEVATEDQRTVKSEWGIAYDGTRIALAYLPQPPLAPVQLFWVDRSDLNLGDPPVRAARPEDEIPWPFVETEADAEHFEALGFLIVNKLAGAR
jgi:ADP-ribose pyrophosphatase YjhB (NUDIX family)